MECVSQGNVLDNIIGVLQFDESNVKTFMILPRRGSLL
jgi:hypothetical protein